ncbi:MAG: glutathione S-transferase N-terminal domain-containing protein [Pseudomonadota bacterium]
MILHSAPASPYARKVAITAHIKGVMSRIETRKAATGDPSDPIQGVNPLSKLPALQLDNGHVVYDSHVICEYLDSLAPTPVLFPQDETRWSALTLAALGDGMLDAALLIVYEGRYRDESQQVASWLEMQNRKIDRAVSHLSAHIPTLGETPHIGHVTVASALGYLDFRLNGRWREGHAPLVAWLDAFEAQVPAFAVTRPHD